MSIEIDPESTVPPYEQVRSQLAAMIGDGRLAVGTRLAPVRQFAAELGLAVNTVARAYRELESAGLVADPGAARQLRRPGAGRRGGPVARAATRYAEEAARLGVPADRALALVRSALGVPPPTGSGPPQG